MVACDVWFVCASSNLIQGEMPAAWIKREITRAESFSVQMAEKIGCNVAGSQVRSGRHVQLQRMLAYLVARGVLDPLRFSPDVQAYVVWSAHTNAHIWGAHTDAACQLVLKTYGWESDTTLKVGAVAAKEEETFEEEEPFGEADNAELEASTVEEGGPAAGGLIQQLLMSVKCQERYSE